MRNWARRSGLMLTATIWRRCLWERGGNAKKIIGACDFSQGERCKSRRVVRTDSNSFGCRGPNAFQKAPPPRFAGVQTSPKPRTYQARDFWSPGSHGRNRCLFCHWLQIDTDCEFDMCLGFIGCGNRAVRLVQVICTLLVGVCMTDLCPTDLLTPCQDGHMEK